MDPLSLCASIIAIGTVAAQTGKAFSKLRALNKSIPGRVHALNNEVADLEVVLYQVASAIEEHSFHAITAEQQKELPQLLFRAEAKLHQLEQIIERVVEACGRTNILLARTRVWQAEQENLRLLQEDIRSIKCSLNIILGASNSRDLVRVQVELQELSIVTSHSNQDQREHQQKLLTSLTQVQHHMDERLDKVENMITRQGDQFEENRSMQLGPLYKSSTAYRRRRRSSPSGPRSSNILAVSEGVGIRVSQSATACARSCPCRCHTQSKKATPKLVERVMGQLFLGYSGLPYFSPKCDSDACEKAQKTQINAEYWFPLGFCWSQIVRLQLGYDPNFGPQFQLATLRQVPDSAQCVNFAMSGNIDGLKSLFKQGLASPRDVSSTRGYSLLRWALYSRQYETCKFLVWEGADVDYRPIAAHDNSPRNKAYDHLLQGGYSRDVTDALNCITQGGDFVEEQNFTILHRIVLGLSARNLEDEIGLHKEDFDTVDGMNRTALTWAAARGDAKSVNTLLSFGADPNILDVEYSGPLTYSALRDHPVCTRLLLEAGANPDPEIPGGRKVGSPLNCASRNAANPLVLKTLLDFGADIEACGVDGRTPLLYASRTGNADFAYLLLEYGANINAKCAAAQTPLTAAIIYNSHDVLQLLLDRWFEYSSCPRLAGPNLLECVARYADHDSLGILTATDHIRLKYDHGYTKSDFVNCVLERSDSSEKLLQAFGEFMEVVTEKPMARHSPRMRLEASLSREKADLISTDNDVMDDDRWSNASSSIFEDALETV